MFTKVHYLQLAIFISQLVEYKIPFIFSHLFNAYVETHIDTHTYTYRTLQLNIFKAKTKYGNVPSQAKSKTG